MNKKKTSAQSEAASVKRTRQKEGPAISPREFLALKKPKGDLVLEIKASAFRSPVLIASIGRTRSSRNSTCFVTT